MRKFLTAILVCSVSIISSCRDRGDETPTLRLVFRANLKSLDPGHTTDLYSAQAMTQIYDRLLQYSYLKRPDVLEPAMAAELPTVSKDGLTYTFKLKTGLKFQDNDCFPGGKGREIVAEDVVYSWKRIADPEMISESFYLIDGKIAGLNEWGKKKKAGQADYSTRVDGLYAKDTHTVVIRLTSVFHQFVHVLATAPFSVVPREAVEKYGKEFINNPVGSGPFMLAKPTDWQRGASLTLTKNPTYREEYFPKDGELGDAEKGTLVNAGKRLPLVDKLIYLELVEEQPRWLTGLKGGIDIFDIPTDSFKSAVADGKLVPELVEKGFRVDSSPALDITYTSFNMDDPLLGKNKKLRQAMSMAFDAKDYIGRFLNGRGIIAESFIPPGLDGYDPNYRNPHAFDLERARAKLAEAGFPGGKGLPEFTYDTLSDTRGRLIAEYFAHSMANIGVKIKISSSSWPQLLSKMRERKSQIFGLGWSAAYADPQAFFMAFYGKNVSPGANLANYINPSFDRLYDQSMLLVPGDERNKVNSKMRDLAMDDAVWILSAHRIGYRMVHGWVEGLKWSEVSLSFPKYVGINPEKRRKLVKEL